MDFVENFVETLRRNDAVGQLAESLYPKYCCQKDLCVLVISRSFLVCQTL